MPQINYYTHGSQVTVSHGHLSFYGAYVLLNLTFFQYAFARRRAGAPARATSAAGVWGFWLLSLGILGMCLAFAVAGVLQAYLERYQGEPYMLAAQPIRFWMLMVFLHGLLALGGALLLVRHFLAPGVAPRPAG